MWKGWVDWVGWVLWLVDFVLMVFLVIKGMMVMVIYWLVDWGLIDYEVFVVEYWLVFGVNGKVILMVCDVM